MKRILFLVLCLFPVLVTQAQADIELYVNGHKFDSLQAYLASRKSPAAALTRAPVSLNIQQEEYIRQRSKQLGIKVDFNKVKTLQVEQNTLPGTALRKLYVMSIENGVRGALQDFYQAQQYLDFPMPRRISSRQLQEAIRLAVTTSKAPMLLIAEPGKLRIMALTAQDKPQ